MTYNRINCLISEILFLNIVTHLEHNATKHMYERLINAKDKSRTHNDTIIKDLICFKMLSAAKIQYIINANMPDKITEDTVGSYLHGCFQPETSVDVACTPACLTGIKIQIHHHVKFYLIGKSYMVN
jgi:hypothetical protein